MIDKYTDPDENDKVTYFLYYGDIKTLTYNDTTYYFLDERGIPYGDDKWIIFNSDEELENAGYTLTDDNFDVLWITNSGFAKMYDKNEKNTYAIYSDFNANKFVYDFTDVKVTLDDGLEYTLVVPNNSVSIDTLQESL